MKRPFKKFPGKKREEREGREERGEGKEKGDREERSERADGEKRPYFKKSYLAFDKKKSGPPFHKKPYKKKFSKDKPFRKSESPASKPNLSGLIRLNRFIANAGICSRREADDLIKSGVVKVNGVIITEMGFKVKPSDMVQYGGQSLRREKMVYVLLNKPKDYITTVDDPEKRKTVLELVQDAGTERIYPVGRLDRATTGVLLLTNDGELTKVLTHPRYGIKKIYNVEIDTPIKHADFNKVSEGLELEDGYIKVDKISYASMSNKKELVIELHSGRNRIVRRIFESMGYKVLRLDRISFAGIGKKDLQRGRWRYLSEKEVGFLKMVAAE